MILIRSTLFTKTGILIMAVVTYLIFRKKKKSEIYNPVREVINDYDVLVSQFLHRIRAACNECHCELCNISQDYDGDVSVPVSRLRQRDFTEYDQEEICPFNNVQSTPLSDYHRTRENTDYDRSTSIETDIQEGQIIKFDQSPVPFLLSLPNEPSTSGDYRQQNRAMISPREQSTSSIARQLMPSNAPIMSFNHQRLQERFNSYRSPITESNTANVNMASSNPRKRKRKNQNARIQSLHLSPIRANPQSISPNLLRQPTASSASIQQDQVSNIPNGPLIKSFTSNVSRQKADEVQISISRHQNQAKTSNTRNSPTVSSCEQSTSNALEQQSNTLYTSNSRNTSANSPNQPSTSKAPRQQDQAKTSNTRNSPTVSSCEQSTSNALEQQSNTLYTSNSRNTSANSPNQPSTSKAPRQQDQTIISNFHNTPSASTSSVPVQQFTEVQISNYSPRLPDQPFRTSRQQEQGILSNSHNTPSTSTSRVPQQQSVEAQISDLQSASVTLPNQSTESGISRRQNHHVLVSNTQDTAASSPKKPFYSEIPRKSLNNVQQTRGLLTVSQSQPSTSGVPRQEEYLFPISQLNKTCVLCRKSFAASKLPTESTLCGHIFHRKCIKKFTYRLKKCPVCGTFTTWKSDTCALCLDRFSQNPNQPRMFISCGHAVHMRCMKQMTQHDSHCSICNEISENECTICLERIAEKHRKQISCGHEFHNTCIDDWALQKNTCPLCRKNMQ